MLSQKQKASKDNFHNVINQLLGSFPSAQHDFKKTLFINNYLMACSSTLLTFYDSFYKKLTNLWKMWLRSAFTFHNAKKIFRTQQKPKNKICQMILFPTFCHSLKTMPAWQNPTLKISQPRIAINIIFLFLLLIFCDSFGIIYLSVRE